MKICLVYPNQTKLPDYFNKITNIPKNPTYLVPLGILYIASNSKYEIDIIDNRITNYSDKELYIKLSDYDIIGFSGTIFDVEQSIKISEKLVANNKITVYGGPNATVNYNLYLNKFSIIFRGEAENVFDELVEASQSNMNFSKLLHKYNFIKENNTFYNKNIIRIQDLNSLNFPDRSSIDLKKYKRYEHEFMENIFPIDTVCSSRGCPFDCSFCSSKHIWKRKYTSRNVDNIIQEIEFLINNYKTKGIYFREDNFTVSEKRLLEFCRKIKKYNIKWICESRVDTLNFELLNNMKSAGCCGIWFGIESTSKKTLNFIKKNINIKQAKTIINYCNNIGIKTGGGFIVGFPNENKDDIIKTFEESKTLGLQHIFYNRLWIIPKSELYDYIIKNNLARYEFQNIIIPDTHYLSADEVTEIYYNFLYNKKIIFLKKFIPQKFVDFLNKNFHPIYSFIRKILY